MGIQVNVAAVLDDLASQAEHHELEAIRIRTTIDALCGIYSQPQSQAAQAGPGVHPAPTSAAEPEAVGSSATHSPDGASDKVGGVASSCSALAAGSNIPERRELDVDADATGVTAGETAPLSETPASQPGSEVAASDAAAAPAGEVPSPVASPALNTRKAAAPRVVAGETQETTNRRGDVAGLNAKHPELTPDDAAARLQMPIANLRIFTKELGIEWAAERPLETTQPVAVRPTKSERIRLVHEAHPTWTARMIANELGEKENTVSTLLAAIRREVRAEVPS